MRRAELTRANLEETGAALRSGARALKGRNKRACSKEQQPTRRPHLGAACERRANTYILYQLIFGQRAQVSGGGGRLRRRRRGQPSLERATIDHCSAPREGGRHLVFVRAPLCFAGEEEGAPDESERETNLTAARPLNWRAPTHVINCACSLAAGASSLSGASAHSNGPLRAAQLLIIAPITKRRRPVQLPAAR